MENYIETNGTDPVSGEPLKVEQLIDVKGWGGGWFDEWGGGGIGGMIS